MFTVLIINQIINTMKKSMEILMTLSGLAMCLMLPTLFLDVLSLEIAKTIFCVSLPVFLVSTFISQFATINN